MWWVIDGNNVVGAGADGWWNDPVAAAERLTQAVATWCLDEAQDDEVTMVFDGRPEALLAGLAGGNLAVDFARRPGRDAADDQIVALVEARFAQVGDDGSPPAITVVTSDRGLVDRLAPGVATEGAGRFRSRLGIGPRPSRNQLRRRDV